MKIINIISLKKKRNLKEKNIVCKLVTLKDMIKIK
jgi:hypothetical protein